MSLAPVIDLLRERIGLDPESLGAAVLPRAVAARLQALRLTSPAAYAGRLVADAQEFQALLDDLTVPETWFFRGGQVFAYLAGQIAQAVYNRSPGSRCRILSVPCSTGEEPFSLALALVEAAVPPAAWLIEGVDLSSRHIERARQGRFGTFSFRETPPDLRQRFFRPAGGGWELDPALRSLVRFRQGNLLDPQFLGGEEPFDLVFCRNLFIYLHADARRRALAALDRLLAPHGLLCTGHAEPLNFRDPHFERTGPAPYFLYRRTTAEAPRPLPAFAHLPRQEPAVPAAGAAPPAPAPVDLLEQARRQADRGHLAEALDTCRAHLAGCGPSADLFSLMGVVHQAGQQKDEAVRCFERALYLEPGHREALTHLLLLRQEQGDHGQAARLRRRLERLPRGGEP
jgi:chemotaxis protein methyltransferase WspC